MSRLAKLRKLTRDDWTILARAVVLVWKAALLLRIHPFQSVLTAFQPEKMALQKRPAGRPARRDAASLYRLVDVAARYTMPGSNCLKKALAASALMRAHRIPAQVVLGTSGARKPFQAHAWVEADGLSWGRESAAACEPLPAFP